MKNLPVPVEVTFFLCQSNSLSRLIDIERQDADIEEMFAFADTDGDGSLSFQEFEVQCTLDLGFRCTLDQIKLDILQRIIFHLIFDLDI